MWRPIWRRPAALAGAILLILAAGVPRVAAASHDTVYLALGDSLAVGDGASVQAHTAYVPRLAGYFTGVAHGGAAEMINLGVGGETTSSIFTSGQLASAVAAINAESDVRVVTLSIGGNDLLDELNESTDVCVQDPTTDACWSIVRGKLLAMAGNYPLILGALQTALAADPGEEKVFVLTLYNPFGGTGSGFEWPVDVAERGEDLALGCDFAQPATIGLDDIIACNTWGFDAYAGATGVHFVLVDSYPAFGEMGPYYTHIGDPGFNIHPTDEGYALIARLHREADRGQP